MSVKRNQNWLGGQRVDVPHLKSVESAVANDFDVLAGRIMAGEAALVVSGFRIPTTGLVGQQASTIQILVAGSKLIHSLATASGSIFEVPEDRAIEVLSSTNGRLVGSFTSGAVNYIGIDLVRTADSTTSDVVQFIDEDTKKEVAKRVPLAKTSDYKIYVSTQDFSITPGLAPVAIVETDSSNNVVSIKDARTLMFRLGQGGSVPDGQSSYAWPDRTEAEDNFETGDKDLSSLKSWVDAIMTRIWELGGGEYWYSATADRNVRMIRTGSPITSSGDWFAWDGTNALWQGLKVVFDNSTGYINEIKDQTVSSSGLTNMADGDCIYVDLDRSQNLTGSDALQPVKVALTGLGTPSVPGSRFILLWRVGSEVFARDSQWKVNAALPPATTSAIGAVKLNQTPGSASAPVVPAINSAGSIVVSEAAASGNIAIRGVGLDTTGSALAGGIGVKGEGGDSEFGNGSDGVQGTGGGVTDPAGGTAGAGVRGTGGTTEKVAVAGPGVVGVGGTGIGATSAGGIGVQGIGGTPGATGFPGYGGIFDGANSSTSQPAGDGTQSNGGDCSSSGDGGRGLDATGGNAAAGAAGIAVRGTGGNGTASNATGGRGGSFGAGSSSGTGAGATGVNATGGNTVNATGGIGVNATGGTPSTTGAGGDGVVGTGGTGLSANTGGAGGNFTGGPNAGTGVIATKAATDTRTGTLDGPGLLIRKQNASNGELNTSTALKFALKDGQETNHFTHLGYPTNQVVKFEEFWTHGAIADVYASGQRWAQSSSLTAGGTVSQALVDPAVGMASSSVTLVATTAGGGTDAATNRLATVRAVCPFVGAVNNKLIFQAEFVVAISAFDSVSKYWIGISSDPTNPEGSVSSLLFIADQTASANWEVVCRNSGGSSSPISTGVAVATAGGGFGTGSHFVLKMEMYGLTTDRAGRMTFSVNGVETNSFTTNIPTANMKPFFAVRNISTSAASKSLYIGPTTAYWGISSTAGTIYR